MTGPIGLVYDIQGFSIQDGPGIRTTVFLKGCPLRCPWCHSPESQSFEKQLSFKKADCLGLDACGACLKACPRGALSASEPQEVIGTGGALPGAPDEQPVAETRCYPVINHELCVDCGACSAACCSKALYLCGDDYTVEAAVARVLKDRKFYESSGGGVTLSGGEPMSQFEFTLAFLKACKAEGLHTALDTTGFASWERYEQVLPYVDLFLFDIKNMDSQLHKAVVGVPNELILENVERIADAGGKIQIRIPVIPQFNNSHEHMQQVAQLCARLGDAVTFVQLLPYHTMGLAKYEKLQWDKPVFEAIPLKDDDVECYIDDFTAQGITAMLH